MAWNEEEGLSSRVMSVRHEINLVLILLRRRRERMLLLLVVVVVGCSSSSVVKFQQGVAVKAVGLQHQHHHHGWKLRHRFGAGGLHGWSSGNRSRAAGLKQVSMMFVLLDEQDGLEIGCHGGCKSS